MLSPEELEEDHITYDGYIVVGGEWVELLPLSILPEEMREYLTETERCNRVIVHHLNTGEYRLDKYKHIRNSKGIYVKGASYGNSKVHLTNKIQTRASSEDVNVLGKIGNRPISSLRGTLRNLKKLEEEALEVLKMSLKGVDTKAKPAKTKEQVETAKYVINRIELMTKTASQEEQTLLGIEKTAQDMKMALIDFHSKDLEPENGGMDTSKFSLTMISDFGGGGSFEHSPEDVIEEDEHGT